MKGRIRSSTRLRWGEFYADQGLTKAFLRSHYLEVAKELGLSYLALPTNDPFRRSKSHTMERAYVKSAHDLALLDFSPGAEVDFAHFFKANSSFEVLWLLDGPFQYLSSCMPFVDWVRLLKREPTLVQETISRYLEALLSLVQSSPVPVAGLVLADDIAGAAGPIYGPKMLDDFYFPFLSSFCQRVNQEVFVHCDGDVYGLLDAYQEAKVTGVQSLEWAGPKTLSMLVSQYPELVFWGGLSRQQLVFEEKEALEALQEMIKLREDGALLLLGSSTGVLDEQMDPAILRSVSRMLHA